MQLETIIREGDVNYWKVFAQCYGIQRADVMTCASLFCCSLVDLLNGGS